MQKIKIACTSSGGLDRLMAKSFNIDIIPILIEHHSKQYREGLDIDAEDFFRQLEITTIDKNNLPKTVVPTAQSTYEVMEKAIAQGYTDIIFVCMSTALGSAYNKIRVDSAAYKDKIKIHMFDTKAIGFVEGYLALRAGALALSGATVEKILSELTLLRSGAYTIGATTNLDYTVYNGRLRGAQAFLGRTLHIKPSLEVIHTGELVSFAKALHCARAFESSAERVKQVLGDCQNYMLWRFYTGEENRKYLPRAEEKFGLIPNTPDVVMPLSTGVHTGPTLAGWGLIKFENS